MPSALLVNARRRTRAPWAEERLSPSRFALLASHLALPLLLFAFASQLRDEIKYQMGLKPEERDADQKVYLREIMSACLKVFDDYLALAPKEEYKTARSAVYGD